VEAAAARIGMLTVSNRIIQRRFNADCKEPGGDEEGRMTTVWIYVDTGKQVGDLDHLKVFVDRATADTWLAENDPEGIAFEYEVLE
jgi:hypothetical protein